MNNSNSFDEHTYKNLIDEAIDCGNTEQADALVNDFCLQEGFKSPVIYPLNFAETIKNNAGKKSGTTKRKAVQAAAILFAVICGLSGTVIASEIITRKSLQKNSRYSISTTMNIEELFYKKEYIPSFPEDIYEVMTNKPSTKKMEQIKNEMEQDGLHVMKLEQETSSPWFLKAKTTCSYYIYSENQTTENGVSIVSTTYVSDSPTTKSDLALVTAADTYLYENYQEALDDSGFPSILPTSLLNQLASIAPFQYNILYKTDRRMEVDKETFSAIFYTKQNGRLRINISKYSEISQTNITHSDTYESKTGTTYLLSEVTQEKTIAAVIVDDHIMSFAFEHMSENEIYDILDKVNVIL